jgi:hypothetical protein
MKSTNAVWLGLLCLAGLGLSACAGDGTLRMPTATPTPYPPRAYAHRVATSHVELYYNCSTPSPGGVHLDGLAVNPWSSQPVRAMEFELVGVDARGWSVSEAKTEARDLQLFTNQSSPFELDLKTAGSEVQFNLYYSYQFEEGGDHNDFQVSKAAWRGPMLLAVQTNRFMVWDACSASAHLAR